MKIITPGKIPENRVYRTTCLHCQCTYEFARHEGKYVSDPRDGDAIVTSCPTCHHEVYTNARQ